MTLAFFPRGRWARRSWLATVLVAFGLLSGCANGGESDHTVRDAAIYRSVVIDLVDRSEADLEPSEDLPVLFIEALGVDGIPLQVQVEVVAGFVEQYEIRFIDQFDEAVEIDLPGQPVRPQSLLIGLGDIDVDETAEVHSELYLSVDDIRGFSYTLVGADDGHWDVVGEPVDIEPEGLVARP